MVKMSKCIYIDIEKVKSLESMGINLSTFCQESLEKFLKEHNLNSWTAEELRTNPNLDCYTWLANMMPDKRKILLDECKKLYPEDAVMEMKAWLSCFQMWKETGRVDLRYIPAYIEYAIFKRKKEVS